MATRRTPERVLRGIAKAEWLRKVEGETQIVNEAFLVPSKPNPARERKGKQPGHELSINWEDDPLDALAQTAGDPGTSAHGAVIVSVSDVRAQPVLEGRLFFERDPIKGNPFHGNIVLPTASALAFRRHVANTLAFVAVASGETLNREQLDARVSELQASRDSTPSKKAPLSKLFEALRRVFRIR